MPESPVSSSGYQEAPMLAELVAAGELPSVDERLPVEPMVIEAISEVGNYCDTWRRCETNPNHVSARLGAEPLVAWARDAQTVIPNLAQSWDVNEEGTELTFHLRRGVRWSDGEPFTADDVAFWFEDVILNQELTPAFPNWLKSGGEPCTFEKIDDYTVKLTFAAPAGLILDSFAFDGNTLVNYPRHYLERFHIDYADADELAALTKERGFESWYQLFSNEVNPAQNPDLPTVRPWRLVTKNWTTTAVAERNPYYWKVDSEGKQLPYYDKVFWNIVQSVDLIPVRVVSGEVDMQAMYIGFPDYTLLMENREAGGYQVYLWDPGNSGSAMHPNQTRTGDDEMRDLLRDQRFRLALSKALNREDMNDLFYLGLSKHVLDMYPESVQNDPDVPGYFEYDVEGANAILDEMGLDQRDGEGTRLLPSGRPIRLMMFGHAGYPIHRDVAEVEAEYLKAIGIATQIDFVAGEVFTPRLQQSDYDVLCYNANIGPGALFWAIYPRSLFPVEVSTYWATRWGWYYQTGGQEGDEPEGEAAYLLELWERVKQTVDADARQALIDEAFMINAKNLWVIPVFGGDIAPCIVKNGVTNVPESGTLAYQVWSPKLYNPEHFFLKQ